MPVLEKGLVVNHVQLSSDMYQIDFLSPKIAAESRPGQFIQIKTNSHTDPLLRRPISLHDIDADKGIISILYRVVGTGTKLLTVIQNGEELDSIGPLGRGFSLPQRINKAVLIGGGVGITPLVYLARQLVENGCETLVLYGTENQDQLVALDKIISTGAKCLTATLNGSFGIKGFVTEPLFDEQVGAGIDFLYTCGPEPMMKQVRDYGIKHNIPGEVSLEEHMACGVGACLGCARKLKEEDKEYVKICKDGPVFNMAEVEFK